MRDLETIIVMVPKVVFLVFRVAGACGAMRDIYKQFCVSHLGIIIIIIIVHVARIWLTQNWPK